MRHSIDFSYPAAQHQAMGAVAPAAARAGRTTSLGARGPGRASRPPAGAGAAPPPPRRRSKQRAARRAGARSTARRARVWVKKIIGFPIGERFAAISLTAALFDARVTFIVMLAWGGFAAALHDRRPRAALARHARPGRARPRRRGATGTLEAYRDDGPLALALGRARRRARAARVGARARGRWSRCSSPIAVAGRRRVVGRSPARRRGVARARRRRLERPPAARPHALGRAARAARARSTPGSCGSPRSPARRPCRPRSRCCWRSRSATTTSSTACAIAA